MLMLARPLVKLGILFGIECNYEPHVVVFFVGLQVAELGFEFTRYFESSLTQLSGCPPLYALHMILEDSLPSVFS